jgi:hypothetical protein
MRTNVVRIQFDVSSERINELDALQQDCGLTTRKELFNNALTLFEWAANEAKNGNVIASVNEDAKRYRELQMPALRTAAAKARGSTSREAPRGRA